MAAPTWPVSLPATPLQEGFGETYEDFNATFEPDVGLPNTWPRSAAAKVSVPWSMFLTAAQRTALISFWKTDCSTGSVAFEITDPVNAVTVTFKFVGGLQFSATGSPSRPWLVRFNLVRLG